MKLRTDVKRENNGNLGLGRHEGKEEEFKDEENEGGRKM